MTDILKDFPFAIAYLDSIIIFGRTHQASFHKVMKCSCTGLKILREASFQQVLLSSSGPKENIFISKFTISLGVSENIMPNNIIVDNFSIL